MGAFQQPSRTPQPLVTPDGRYIVVRGRLWRAANPNLAPDRHELLVRELMDARRAVGRAKRCGDLSAQNAAHAAVDAAKHALGERGAPWWDDGAPDLNRHLAKNSPYLAWFAAQASGLQSDGEIGRTSSAIRENIAHGRTAT